MRCIAFILLWFSVVNQSQAKYDSDSLALKIQASILVTACTAWVEDSASTMSGNITLPPVTLSELQQAQTSAGKTTFKIKFQCSYDDAVDIYEGGGTETGQGYRSLAVRFTAKSEVDPTTQILKNSHQESANGAKDIGFLIKGSGNNVVQFETATDSTSLISATQTTALCEKVDPEYQNTIDVACVTYSFPYSVEYAAYGDNPGPGLVDADATVTVDWQ